MKKKIELRGTAPKPRHPLAALLRRCGAGVHRPFSRQRQKVQKDLLQRLREAGL
jgi:hypothetical protein